MTSDQRRVRVYSDMLGEAARLVCCKAYHWDDFVPYMSNVYLNVLTLVTVVEAPVKGAGGWREGGREDAGERKG